MNETIRRHLASTTSLRRLAIILNLSRTTLGRKLIFLGAEARKSLNVAREDFPLVSQLQFDDLETFEHSKYKPLAITLVVESYSRRILGFEVARMSPKGKALVTAQKKYGPVRDERKTMRRKLFAEISPYVHPTSLEIRSDQNPHYPADVNEFFPQARYLTFASSPAAAIGQGELKKVMHDPIFTVNHTNAMLRANVNRLIRKTWCTTKRRDRLADHLAIYAQFHNQTLIPQRS